MVASAACDGVNAAGISQEVGESDEALSVERGASVDAGEVGAALDPL